MTSEELFVLEECITNHRKMWNWMADESEKQKRIVWKDEYFRKNGIKELPYSKCYACVYANSKKNQKRCPFYFRNPDTGCIDPRSPDMQVIEMFQRYGDSTNEFEEYVEICRKSANNNLEFKRRDKYE